jgi:hypothetical protein
MNILGAIFPLGSFHDETSRENVFSEHLQLTFPWAGTCLLRGDADQCYRALLFQASLSYASIGKRVSFYTPTRLQAIPALVHNQTPHTMESMNLHLIQFHYLVNLTDVHQHVMQSSSDIIIIDGYLEFPLSKRDDRFHIIAACALLRDTYDYLHGKSPMKNNLVLLCTCTCADLSLANVEQHGLFNLAIDIEMHDNGDYCASSHILSNKTNSCQIHFRMSSNEIRPLFATIEHSK